MDELIERLAQECSTEEDLDIIRFAALIAEECAKEVEKWSTGYSGAEAIRERFNPTNTKART